MKYFDAVYDFFNQFDQRTFFQILAGFLAVVCLVLGFFIYRYYSNVSYLHEQIEEINELRKDARTILNRAHLVQQQQTEVKKLLEENRDFKIGGYFEKLITQLQLTDKEASHATSTIDRHDNYRENIYNAKFVDLNMKDITELLQEIDQSPLVFTKELDIIKSEKKPGTLEVSLTIATLEPKEAT